MSDVRCHCRLLSLLLIYCCNKIIINKSLGIIDTEYLKKIIIKIKNNKSDNL